MIYIAIIGDFIDSKGLSERYHVQERFKTCLDHINEKFKNFIISKFSITLGDEFQGLLKQDAPIFQIIDYLNYLMHPYQIRYGLGLGKILTDINPEISIGADGPAYWLAREAITYIHQKNDYGQTHLAIRTENPSSNPLLNSLLAAGEAIKSNWRTSQVEVFYALLELDNYNEQFNQQILGDKLHLSASALSKRLKSSSLKVYLRSRNSAKQLLETLNSEGE
ncbi:SatD family protein [Streptococcus didelphis]|uniref:SatD family protein n=1 Tax=Streptococcus didelphis TaxID=102886 RepID=A0ABY9LHI1_9STRE|nr:SatD family protein [Streptococcus didelphis]WMB28279.1 SatD family protein [Streptococcus didelphis]WMB28950.1 SatD family protein [Streptococcus didelphis]